MDLTAEKCTSQVAQREEEMANLAKEVFLIEFGGRQLHCDCELRVLNLLSQNTNLTTGRP